MTNPTKAPIAPQTLRDALDELIDDGTIEKNGRNRGQTWLANRVGVSRRTVHNWLSGATELKGAYAVAVRSVLENHLE